MTWEVGPGPGDGKQGPEWGPRIAKIIMFLLIAVALMAYCGTKGG